MTGVKTYIEETYELYTFNEHVTKTHSTPAALNRCPYTRYNLLTGRYEIRYAFPLTDRPRPTLKVIQYDGVEGTAQHMPDNVPLQFQGHLEMLVHGLVQKTFTEQGITDISPRINSMSETIARGEKKAADDAAKQINMKARIAVNEINVGMPSLDAKDADDEVIP